MTSLSLKSLDEINTIISQIELGVDYDSRTDDKFSLNTHIRFIARNEEDYDKKLLDIMVGSFVISRVWNKRIEFTLPLPINEYFKTCVNGFIMNSSIRMVKNATCLEITTDVLNKAYLKKKKKKVTVNVRMGDNVIFEDNTTAIGNKLFSDNIEESVIERTVEYHTGEIVVYQFHSGPDRAVSVVVTLPFKSHKLFAINNNNNDESEENVFVEDDYEDQKVCNVITRRNAACLAQLSQYIDNNPNAKQTFDHISVNCYLKQDLLMYFTIINKITMKYIPEDIRWSISSFEIPENCIAYGVSDRSQKYKTIVEKQKRIVLIKPLGKGHNKFRFAEFKRGIGFQINGVWKEYVPIEFDEDIWEDVDLNDNNVKENIDLKELGPHTSEEAEEYKNIKIEIAKEHLSQLNCTVFTKIKSIFL